MKKSISLFLFATTSLLSETLDWKQALQEVAKGNLDIISAKANVNAQEAQLKVAYSFLAPQINANINYNENRSTFPFGDSVNVTQQKRYSAQISASQQLFNYSSFGGISQAKANIELSKIALRMTKATVEYNLKVAFQSMLYAQENIKIAEEFLKLRNENLRIVRLRFESGFENKGAVVVAEAYLKQAGYYHNQAKDTLFKASKQLAQVLGREQEPSSLYVRGEVPIDILPEARKLKTSLSQPNFRALALLSPTYENSLANIKLAEAQIELAKAGFMPSVSLTGTYGRVDQNLELRQDNWSIGAGINIPIFSGLSSIYTLSSSKSNLTVAEAKSRAIMLSTELDLLTKYFEFSWAQEQLQVAKAFYDAEVLRAKISKAEYLNGFLNYTQWDLINDSFVTKTQAYLQAKLNLVVKEALWQQALGHTNIQN